MGRFGEFEIIMRQETKDKISMALKGNMNEIITNEQGGKQSKIKGEMSEVPPLALIEVSTVMAIGHKNYPREANNCPNWHKIDSISNLDHCLEHAFNFLAERNKPDRDIAKMKEELSHCAARSLMALEQFIREHTTTDAVKILKHRYKKGKK